MSVESFVSLGGNDLFREVYEASGIYEIIVLGRDDGGGVGPN